MISRRGFFQTTFGFVAAAVAAPFLPKLDTWLPLEPDTHDALALAVPVDGEIISIPCQVFRVGDIFTIGTDPTLFRVTHVHGSTVASEQVNIAEWTTLSALAAPKTKTPRPIWHPPISRSRYQRRAYA